MAKENLKRKPAAKPPTKKRTRYVPDWKPLLAKWNELKDERGYAQKAMGIAAGATEGAISQLLNGTTKLTVEWALQFSKYMRIPVIDIWPDFPFKALFPGSLSPDEVEIALLYRAVRDPKQRDIATALLRTLAKPD